MRPCLWSCARACADDALNLPSNRAGVNEFRARGGVDLASRDALSCDPAA
jgi:hypothetical protein